MLVVGTVHVPCSCPCAPYDMYSWAIPRRLSKNWRRECAWFTGWWFGTFVIFPYIGNVIIPTDKVIFFRGGRYTTNQYIFVEPFRGAQLNKRPHSLLVPSSEIVKIGCIVCRTLAEITWHVLYLSRSCSLYFFYPTMSKRYPQNSDLGKKKVSPYIQIHHQWQPMCASQKWGTSLNQWLPR